MAAAGRREFTNRSDPETRVKVSLAPAMRAEEGEDHPSMADGGEFLYVSIERIAGS